MSFNVFVVILLLASSAQSFSPNVVLESCPFNCTCENTLCSVLKKQGTVECVGLQVKCVGNNQRTSLPTGIPRNVTGLVVQDFNFSTIDLNQFGAYPNLNALILANNSIFNIHITKILKNIMQLSLMGNYIKILPKKSLARMKSVEQLVLRDNKITNIRGVRFPRKVDYLDLRTNKIKSLTGGLFKGCKKMRVLKLSSNLISTVHKNSFANVNKLEVLELDNNRITKLYKLMFSKLHKCWYINLQNNSIKTIHRQAFMPLRTPTVKKQINLKDNLIRFLSIEMLSSVLQYKEFYVLNFAGNPIFCDCNLLNLREEAGTTLTDTGHIVCAGPPENFHLRVIHLSFEDCCF